MAKGYMNQHEKRNFLFLNGLLAQTNKIIAEMATHDGDKQALKHLRTGSTNIYKGMRNILQQLNSEREIEKVVRECQYHDVFIAPINIIEKKLIEEEKREREIRENVLKELGPDPVYTIAEYALLTCRNCDGKPNCVEGGCQLNAAMETLRIPIWGVSDMCQYAGAGKVENRGWWDEHGKTKSES